MQFVTYYIFGFLYIHIHLSSVTYYGLPLLAFLCSVFCFIRWIKSKKLKRICTYNKKGCALGHPPSTRFPIVEKRHFATLDQVEKETRIRIHKKGEGCCTHKLNNDVVYVIHVEKNIGYRYIHQRSQHQHSACKYRPTK